MDRTSALVLISRAAPLFPNRPAIATMWRWATRGCRGVVLRTTLIGGRRYLGDVATSSEEAAAEFIDALNSRPAAPLSSHQAARAKAASERLERAGF